MADTQGMKGSQRGQDSQRASAARGARERSAAKAAGKNNAKSNEKKNVKGRAKNSAKLATGAAATEGKATAAAATVLADDGAGMSPAAKAGQAAPGFQPVRATRAYEAIVEQVEAALASGALVPGSRLPSERDLMTQFGVARSTVREALRVLESDGLIKSRPGDPRGAEVLRFTANSLSKPLKRLASFDTLSLCELVQFRMIIESAACQLAALMRTEFELDQMAKALDRMIAAIDEGYEEFSAADMAYHQVVADVSGNMLIKVCSEVVAQAVLELIADKLANAPDREAQMRQSLNHHIQVFEAIKEGDGDEAADLVRAKLFEYYADYVPSDERPKIEVLIVED